MPKELLGRAHKYLRRRKGKSGDLLRLQQLREDAEKARVSAMAAEQEAAKQREEYQRKTQELEQTAKEEAELREWRMGLQPNDTVHVERFGKTGKVARVNLLKGTISVSVGLGQWEVPFDEIHPAE